jgi:hypothetical protein
MTCCCCCSSSSLIVISVLGLLVILSRAIGAKRNLNGDSDSGSCRRRHRPRHRPTSDIRVDSATPAAAATAIARATEGEKDMVEADEDAMDCALPLPDSAMEPCTKNM